MQFIRRTLSKRRPDDALRRSRSELSQETSPFPDIVEPVNRSILADAHRSRRRGSSLGSLISPLCATCRQLDLAQAPRTLAYSTYTPGGVLLGHLEDFPAKSKCPLCQLLSQVCRETCAAARRPADPYGPLLQLRAFYLLPHLHEQWYLGRGASIENQTSDFFVAAIPSQFSMAPGSSDRALFNNMVARRGFLVYHEDKGSADGRALTPRLVSAYFNPCIVQNWLRVCLSQHGGCRIAQYPQPGLNLIDCRSREVLNTAEVGPNFAPKYVALSYVWGNNVAVSESALHGSRLPRDLPLVIEDAIDVVLKLGYHYLWVDKYCIDQNDKCKKHEQLMHMGYVYKNATLTIVAAAGHDESHGLPGVSLPRPPRQVSFKSEGEGYELTSTLPLPHSSIANSKWASRGWTYQEAILSRRRLVFTDDQLYFECSSASCSEGFGISFDTSSSVSETSREGLIRSSLFSLQQLTPNPTSGGREARLSNFITYLHCAEQYSKRTLSFDHDSLLAFSGIIRILESINPFPVRHIWGVPFFHPDDDNLAADQLKATYQSFQLPAFWKSPTLMNNSAPKAPSPDAEGFDYLAYLMLGLCWWHHPSEKAPRRRHDLPSWSWTGWEGSLTWPKPRKSSDIRSSTWAETAISLASDSAGSVPELYHKSTDAHLLAQSNKSLHIRTSAISPTAFVFNGLSRSLALTTGGEVVLYPSKNDLDASRVFKRIQSGRYEVIRLATVGENTYMMLIKRYRNAYYRIGTMVIQDLYLTYSLFTSMIKTFKLR